MTQLSNIKCPNCGLVNFPDAQECRRCKGSLVAVPTGPAAFLPRQPSIVTSHSVSQNVGNSFSTSLPMGVFLAFVIFLLVMVGLRAYENQRVLLQTLVFSHLIMLGGGLFARSISESLISQDHQSEILRLKYNNYGGWLIAYALGSGVTLGSYVMSIVAALRAKSMLNQSTPIALQTHSLDKLISALNYEIIANLLALALSVVFLTFFFRKSKHVPPLAFVFYLVGLALTVIDLSLYRKVLGSDQYSQPGRARGTSDLISSMTDAYETYMLYLAAGFLINSGWVAYFQLSKRVKDTFVH